MKTTVELPDDLFRKVKAAAALRGRKFKDLAVYNGTGARTLALHFSRRNSYDADA